jgi:hypothetical protein
LEPLEIDIHSRSELAFHVQPDAAVTVTERLPPAASNEKEDVESVNAHADGVGCVGVFSQPIKATEATARRARCPESLPRTNASRRPAGACAH